MKPTNFKQSNKILQKPENMTDEECSPLPVFTDEKVCISCWEAGIWERIKFLFCGRIWVWIFSGKTQPPVSLETKNPFSKDTE